jgi:hypothetical protein
VIGTPAKDPAPARRLTMPLRIQQSSPSGELAICAAPDCDPFLDAEEAQIPARDVRANL